MAWIWGEDDTFLKAEDINCIEMLVEDGNHMVFAAVPGRQSLLKTFSESDGLTAKDASVFIGYMLQYIPLMSPAEVYRTADYHPIEAKE